MILQDLYTSRHDKNPCSGLPTRSDTNLAVQQQMMARGLKYWILEVERLYYIYVAKVMALMSCMVTTQLICAFVFAYTVDSEIFA